MFIYFIHPLLIIYSMNYQDLYYYNQLFLTSHETEAKHQAA